MSHSQLIENARQQIDAVKGKQLSVEERVTAAISLAGVMLEEANRIQTRQEKEMQAQLARMMEDPIGKAFTTAMTDQCFRSHVSRRAADQLIYLLNRYGIPSYLSNAKKTALSIFKSVGKLFSPLLVPLIVRLLRQETSQVILPGEDRALKQHILHRREEGVRVNLNHLGEAILGEKEAENRLQIYLQDLAKPEVEYISVKISTIYSQINLLAWNDTLEILAERLRKLYRAAKEHKFIRHDGKAVQKFVNLDMEEYRDLQLTVALFRKVLDEPEFDQLSAGIVLQAYLPDSFLFQQELTIWAIQRISHGGAPIKIRLVKGANLAMEKVEASLRVWPQAPYTTKEEVDANYKRMIHYGCEREHAEAAHLGIGSHNLFDIAYALLLRAENGVENEVAFEMLEGMADHIRRVVQEIAGGILLYCPAAKKEEFQNAVAYLIRRLDENTAKENFLHDLFNLSPGSEQWIRQVARFTESCINAQNVSYLPRRNQNRLIDANKSVEKKCFQNEPDTDWSLPQNRKWIEKIVHAWKEKKVKQIPLVLGDEIIPPEGEIGIGDDPSNFGKTLYQYVLATPKQIDKALKTAKLAEESYGKTPVLERAQLLQAIADSFRQYRGELIGAMVADTAKTIPEADIEVSEAIDFAEYYSRNLLEWSSLEDIDWSPKGTVLVAPPWNFPCSIPAGGIVAALATGNCVIFKPAAESVYVGWYVAKACWEAGVSQKVLQFLVCNDEPVGSLLIQDQRVNAVILTGATETAKLFFRLRPGLDLLAETGGKNTMVITDMSDRDLAIKDLLQSAFGHSGQKCSACSLAILQAEVYDDPHFRKQLYDAASSIRIGSAWNMNSRMPPLIREPGVILLKGLTELENGEEWLLKPERNPSNPNLWSPGIKLGVKPGSFTFQNELFGPVLGLVRANTFEHALELMNMTRYGLTAGIHSLDEREQAAWLDKIQAGNCYINRSITGAIVQRQPFGGCKESGFGKGAKAGGPNYLTQLMHAKQVSLPIEREERKEIYAGIFKGISREEREIWEASIGSYYFYWKHYFSKKHDPSIILGQDNFQCYVPHQTVTLRIQEGDARLDVLRVIAAALTCQTTLVVSTDDLAMKLLISDCKLPAFIKIIKENDEDFIQRLHAEKIERVRLLKQPTSMIILEAFAKATCHLNVGPVLANGRLELLHYLREVSISRDYHRYGNIESDTLLSEREKENRVTSKQVCREGPCCQA